MKRSTQRNILTNAAKDIREINKEKIAEANQ